jgi:DNA-binding NtrC family response regulator
VTAARREQPDICLIDIRMPGGGIRATAKIVSALPDTTVVMYTVSQSDADLFDVLRAGASGYLLKDTDVSPVTVRTHISSILKKLGRAFTASRHEPTGGDQMRGKAASARCDSLGRAGNAVCPGRAGRAAGAQRPAAAGWPHQPDLR